jgi:FixJ family two-component response regulator
MDGEVNVICACADEWRRLRVSHVLDLAGFRVRPCASERELLHVIAHGPRGAEAPTPVLLLDTRLTKELPASEIVAALRLAVVPIRTVILADRADEAEVIRCMREGADDFIHFPTDANELIDVVNRVSVVPGIR